MGLVQHAETELDVILKKCTDEDGRKIQKVINEDILALVKVFAGQGHSGTSAGYAIEIAQKLMRYQPLTPLTGADDEWSDVRELSGPEGPYQQNLRRSSVFRDKRPDGTWRVYDIDGIKFTSDWGLSWFTRGGGKSRGSMRR